MDQEALFDESVTHKKVEAYRSHQHEDLSIKTSGTFAEMVEEVERVSRQLRDTKLLLTRTRTELEGSHERERDLQAQIMLRDERINQLHSDYDALDDKVTSQDSNQKRVRDDNRQLRATLQQKEEEVKTLQDENSLLLDEGQKLRDEKQELKKELAAKEAGMSRPTLESRLRRAVELLKKDVERTKEKFQKSQDELFSQKRSVEKLESTNAELTKNVQKYELQASEKSEALTSCQRRLRQATEETASLVEEVAAVREELNRTKKIAEGHESIMRREITDKVGEKIKLQVRETVTEQVTKKVTREVTAAMKAEREKEINTLREKFKLLFKENSLLKQQIEASTTKVDYAKKLEDQVPSLTDEIQRLRALLEETKKEHEISTGELESHFRRKIHAIREEAARDKWSHAGEIRRQISKERDREVAEFTSRMEALSKQTDDLLQRAEKEKEEYAEEVKKRISVEKQNEINALAQKLERRTKESDTLIQEAAKDKEAYGNLIRQQVQEESQREVNKYIYRLEVMAAERDNLVKRIQHFEQELSWTWKENESNSDQLKSSLSDLKATEDEVFKLRRKNQNLTTLVERYKQDFEEISTELQQTKQEFRDAMIKSDEQKAKLNDKLARREAAIEQSGHEFGEALRDLENAKQALNDTNRAYEADMARMKEQYENLEYSRNVQRGAENYASAIESENLTLKGRVRELESLLHAQHERSAELDREIMMLREERERVQNSVSNMTVPEEGRKFEESLWALEAENAQLKSNIEDLDTLVEHYKQVAKSADLEISKLRKENENVNESMVKIRSESEKDSKPSTELKEENDRLKANNKELTSYLAFYKAEQSKLSAESIRQRTDFEQSLKASQQEIEEIKQQLKDTNTLLDQYRSERTAATKDLEKSKQLAEDALTVASEEDTVQLNMEIQTLEKLLDRYKAAKAELLSDEDVAGLDLKRALMFSEKEIIRLKDEIADLRVALNQRRSEQFANDPSIFEEKISDLQQEIEELKAKLSQSQEDCSEAIEKLTNSSNENQNLNVKINDLNNLLERYRNELSNTSEELENSKQLLATESEEATRLQQRVESLNLLLDTTEQNHIENSKAFKESKQLFDEANTAYEEEIFRLKGEIGNLKRLQDKNQKKHVAEMERAEQRGLELEATLREAAKAVKIGEGRVAFLESELEKWRVQFADVSEELMHSKRMFKEALMKTERSKHEIQEKMRDMKVDLEKAQSDKESMAQDLEESHLELQHSLVVAAARARDKVKDMESLLNKANGDNVKLSKQLHKSEKKLQVSMEVWADEKASLRQSIENLKGLLDTSRKENAKITKDLQHSMKLFKEALVAWREETQSLNDELYVLRQSSEHHNHHDEEQREEEDDDDHDEYDEADRESRNIMHHESSLSISAEKEHTEHSSVIDSFSDRPGYEHHGIGRDPPAAHATLAMESTTAQQAIDRSRSSRSSYGESVVTEESDISHSDPRLMTTPNTTERSTVGVDNTESTHFTLMSSEGQSWNSHSDDKSPPVGPATPPAPPPAGSQSTHLGSRQSDSSGGTGSLEESDKIDVDGRLVSAKQVGNGVGSEQNSLTTTTTTSNTGRANSSSAASQSVPSSMVSRAGTSTTLTAEKKKRVTWKEEATGYEVSATPSDLSSDNAPNAVVDTHSSDIPSEVTGIVRTKQNYDDNHKARTDDKDNNEPTPKRIGSTKTTTTVASNRKNEAVAVRGNRPSVGTSTSRRRIRRRPGDGLDDGRRKGDPSTTAESRQDSVEGDDGTVSVENTLQRASAPSERDDFADGDDDNGGDDGSVDSTDEIIRASLRNNMQTWNKALEEFSEILREGHSNRSNRSTVVEYDLPKTTTSTNVVSSAPTSGGTTEAVTGVTMTAEDGSGEGSNSSRKKTIRWSKTVHEQTFEENEIVSTSDREHKTFVQVNPASQQQKQQQPKQQPPKETTRSVATRKKKKKSPSDLPQSVVVSRPERNNAPVVVATAQGGQVQPRRESREPNSVYSNTISSNSGDVRDDTSIPATAAGAGTGTGAVPSDADTQFSWSVSSRVDEDLDDGGTSPPQQQQRIGGVYNNVKTVNAPGLDDTDDESTLNWQLLGDYSESTGYSTPGGQMQQLLEQRVTVSTSQSGEEEEETATTIESSKHSRTQGGGDYGNNNSNNSTNDDRQSRFDARSANQLASIASPTTTTTTDDFAAAGSRQSEGDITVVGEMSSATTPKSMNAETVGGSSTNTTDSTIRDDDNDIGSSSGMTVAESRETRGGDRNNGFLSNNDRYQENRDVFPTGAYTNYNDYVGAASLLPHDNVRGAAAAAAATPATPTAADTENTVSSHSTSSHTTSSYSSTLSYSVHDSSASSHHSRTTLDLTSDKALLNRAADNILKKFRQKSNNNKDGGGTNTEGTTTTTTTTEKNAISTDGEANTATSSKESSSKSSRKTGFQRSLEKASRRLWSQSDLHRFMKKKSRRKKSKTSLSSPGGSNEDRPYDERSVQDVDNNKTTTVTVTSQAVDNNKKNNKTNNNAQGGSSSGSPAGATSAAPNVTAAEEISSMVSNSSATTNQYDNESTTRIVVKESNE